MLSLAAKERLAEFFSQPGGRRLVVISRKKNVAPALQEFAAHSGTTLATIHAAEYSVDALIDRIENLVAQKPAVILIANFDVIRSTPRSDWRVRATTQFDRDVGYIFVIRPSSIGWISAPTAGFYKQLSCYIEV